MNQFAIPKHQIKNSPVRLIGIFMYPGVEIMGIVGLTEVFAFANKALQMNGLTTDPVYTYQLLAKDDQPVTTLSGVQIVPNITYQKFAGALDTLIIPGGDDPYKAIKDADLIKWIGAYCKRAKRLASVCTGAFLLAKAGLLDGRRATTHWDYSNSFKEAYPLVRLEPDKILIRDGSVWSSGGVTSGIDLALSLVEEDWGYELALYIARFLAVFLKRTSVHSQCSPYLTMGAANRGDSRDLQAWITENPCVDLRVNALAKRVEMSPRHFARTFLLETGVTPAKYVECVRTDLARHYLENTNMTIQVVTQQVGFKDTETMRRTFTRHVGVNPVDYRDRYGYKRQTLSEVKIG